MEKMLKSKDKQKIARVTEAFLKMKKFDIETLERAYEANKWGELQRRRETNAKKRCFRKQIGP